MGVLNDYMCSEHGIFEAWEPKCPIKFCNGDLHKVFLQPVSIKSEKTKFTDKNLRGLAQDFDMTDIKSTREGEYQAGYFTRNNSVTNKETEEAAAALQQREARPGDSVIWGNGGNISMKSVMNGQFQPVRDEAVSINPRAAGNLTGPRAASYISDHENLSVSK